MNVRIFCHQKIFLINNIPLLDSLVVALKVVDLEYKSINSKMIRESINDILISQGWSSKVKLSPRSQITITAMNGGWALCLQTGNVSRIYADLLKLQYLYRKGNIMDAIYILPTKFIAKKIGSNVANYERIIKELPIFSDVITVPIVVLGIDIGD